MIGEIICLVVLVGVTIMDIMFRRIPVEVLLLMNLGALMYQMVSQKEEIIVVAGGIAIGILFLFLSKATRESMGYGDSLGILCLGVYLGLWKVLVVLSGAFFLVLLSAIFILVRKRMSRKSALPFYPFLTASYAIWMITEVKRQI